MCAGNSFLVEVSNLWHIYDGEIAALRGVNLQIASGGIVAIVGANGSGKTTLIKHFNGLLQPSEGNVIVKGMNTRNTKTSQLAKVVGYVFQNPDHQIFSSTVLEETLFGLKQMKVPNIEARSRAARALEAVNLYDMRDRHPRQLSHGQRQRLATASVLALETQVLVLDEPTTGQDFVARRQIMSLAMSLESQGRTIILVTHDMSLVAEYASRVIVMKDGQTLTNTTPIDLFSQDDILVKTGLKLPPVIEIYRGLDIQQTTPSLTIEDMCTLISSQISKGKH